MRCTLFLPLERYNGLGALFAGSGRSKAATFGFSRSLHHFGQFDRFMSSPFCDPAQSLGIAPQAFDPGLSAFRVSGALEAARARPSGG